MAGLFSTAKIFSIFGAFVKGQNPLPRRGDAEKKTLKIVDFLCALGSVVKSDLYETIIFLYPRLSDFICVQNALFSGNRRERREKTGIGTKSIIDKMNALKIEFSCRGGWAGKGISSKGNKKTVSLDEFTEYVDKGRDRFSISVDQVNVLLHLSCRHL